MDKNIFSKREMLMQKMLLLLLFAILLDICEKSLFFREEIRCVRDRIIRISGEFILFRLRLTGSQQ